METIFPKEKGYKGFFMVSFRKNPDNPVQTQRTGTVILKRTYDIDPGAGIISPRDDAFPVFLTDYRDNVVLNSGFDTESEDGSIYFWEPENVSLAQQVDGQPDTSQYILQVKGAAHGRVVQRLTFNKPLGGRQFWLSFDASADIVSARVENVQLEAENYVICSINADLSNTMQRFCATGTWPGDLQEKEMKIVLRMATNNTRTVYYDNVQVEERDHLTVWNPETTLRYESDLAAFKLEGDIIVLGFTDSAGLCRVNIDGRLKFHRDLRLNSAREKALFGWEPRVNDAHRGRRQDKAGGYSKNADDYPLKWPLSDPKRDPLPGGPGDERVRFENIFFNGYRRTTADVPDDPEKITAFAPFPYIPAKAQIRIERDGGSDYIFSMHGDAASAEYYYYQGAGPDDKEHWTSKNVVMNLDTLVIEPEQNHCYLVWRGVWNFDEHSVGDYRLLEVRVSEQ